MERSLNIELSAWRMRAGPGYAATKPKLFAGMLLTCMCLSALMASWAPLQFSIVTVFLFAGPHNWFEFRYFLMRLPARFGQSRNFFLVAFTGIGFLTLTYLALPALYYAGLWS